MKEVSLNYRFWDQKDSPRKYNLRPNTSVPNLDMEETLGKIVERVKNGEKVYIKFADDHDKRPGAIGLIHNITGDEFTSRHWQKHYNEKETIYEDNASWLVFNLKWDDRKNKAKVDVQRHIHNDTDIVYLPDYEGPTVWSMFDAKAYAEEHAIKPRDRMGKELSVNDTVVYINARYGSGACLDFGVVREIKNKADGSSKSVSTELIIETIALQEGERTEKSTIRHPDTAIMRMTDVDLMDEAFIRKLTVTQTPTGR